MNKKINLTIISLSFIFNMSHATISRNLCSTINVKGQDKVGNIITDSSKVSTELKIEDNYLILTLSPHKRKISTLGKYTITANVMNKSNVQVCDIKLIPVNINSLKVSGNLKYPKCIEPKQKISVKFKVEPVRVEEEYHITMIARGSIYGNITIDSNNDKSILILNTDKIFKSGISGIVYYDINRNCKFDKNIDRPITDRKVVLNDGRYIYTDESGHYFFSENIRNNKQYTVKVVNENILCNKDKIFIDFANIKTHNIPVEYKRIYEERTQKVLIRVKLSDVKYNVSKNKVYITKLMYIKTEFPDTKVELPSMYRDKIDCNKPVIKTSNGLLLPAKGTYVCKFENPATCLPFKVIVPYIKIEDDVCIDRNNINLEISFPFGKYKLSKQYEEKLVLILNRLFAYTGNNKKVLIKINSNADLVPVKDNNPEYRNNMELTRLRAKYIYRLIEEKTVINSLDKVKIIW